jgi:putative heme iron utilization protein
MTPEDASRLRELLTGQRLIALALVVDGGPVAGLLPYAVGSDSTSLVVQASRLARHSRGLVSGAAWSGVVHEPDAAERDALQVPRLLLEGTVEGLDPGGPDYLAAADALRTRFPSAAMTLTLADFGLFRLVIEAGRLVLGFGHALNLSRHHFSALATS